MEWTPIQGDKTKCDPVSLYCIQLTATGVSVRSLVIHYLDYHTCVCIIL